jgi:hypothetical protein
MPPIAESQAPGTDDPVAMARHIKEAAYFLRADLVGICKLPPYAVFSNNKFDGKPVELAHKYAGGQPARLRMRLPMESAIHHMMTELLIQAD